jgi:hypothetical protein
MQVRQVVTGHDAEGRGVFVRDEQVDRRTGSRDGAACRAAAVRQLPELVGIHACRLREYQPGGGHRYRPWRRRPVPWELSLPAAEDSVQRRRADVPHVVGDVDRDSGGNDLVDAIEHVGGQLDPVGGEVAV